MKSFQVSCKKFREERPWTRPSEKGLERKGSTRTYVCIRTHAGARGRKKVYREYRVPRRWESASLPRPLEPVARENLLPPSLPAPAPWEWGGAVSSLGGRDDVEVSLRSLYTMPSPRSFYLRVARVHLRPSAKLYGRRGGRIVDRLLRPYWIIRN